MENWEAIYTRIASMRHTDLKSFNGAVKWAHAAQTCNMKSWMVHQLFLGKMVFFSVYNYCFRSCKFVSLGF